MGVRSSSAAENTGALADWVLDRIWKDTKWSFEFRHLTLSEQNSIDKTIVRTMATNRRIETKLLEMGKDDPHILDGLCWDKL